MLFLGYLILRLYSNKKDIFIFVFVKTNESHMKLSRFLSIFLISIFALFIFQALWLNYAYHITLRNIQETINSTFSEAIEKELSLRFIYMEKENIKQKDMEDDIFEDSNMYIFNPDLNKIENEGIISEHSLMIQKIMDIAGIPLSLSTADSIFKDMLSTQKKENKFQISYYDSSDNILSTSGSKIDKGFHICKIPIVDGNYVQAIVSINPPNVFAHMLGILIVSIILFLFITITLGYEVKSYLNQQKINQIREDFTFTITHEMKTPLASIHAVLDQINKGLLDKNPDMREKFSQIAIEQVLNMQTLVNQILACAYIEKKQLSLNKQSVDLSIMIQSLIDKFSVKKEKDIQFSTQFEMKDVIPYIDPFYFSNAISNLIDNAVKYSGDSVEIKIRCIAREKHIFIIIKDNGHGISQEDQEKIFERFERGAEIKRKSATGFGLGLNYVKKVVEAHGGIITLSSREKKGSEFTIALPILLKSVEVEEIEEDIEINLK